VDGAQKLRRPRALADRAPRLGDEPTQTVVGDKRAWPNSFMELGLGDGFHLRVVELAVAVGISQNYLSEIETGRRKGPAGLQKKFARALGVPVDLLIE